MEVPANVSKLLFDTCRLEEQPVPTGASEADIQALQNAIGIAIPDELKAWLGVCNGADIEPDCLLSARMDGTLASIDTHYAYEPQWKENGWIPITGDGVGNYYVLDTTSTAGSTHPIYFIDQEDTTSAAYVVASGLWPFLFFHLSRWHRPNTDERFYWPFDKEQVLSHDPALSEYAGAVPLPWET